MGTDTYTYNSYITYAAWHMGIVPINERKTLYIKIVKSPEGGYRGTTKNGIKTTAQSTINTSVNGYIFVKEDGTEIKSPTINSFSATGEENSVNDSVNVTLDVEYKNGATENKCYYSIYDNGKWSAYKEGNIANNVCTFEVLPHKNYDIKAYVVDSNGATSEIFTITAKASNEIPKPIIKILKPDSEEEFEENDPTTVEYNGNIWYPYGTRIKTIYPENMTNLSGTHTQKYTFGTYTTTGIRGDTTANNPIMATETATYHAKITDSAGEIVEAEPLTIHIMPREKNGFSSQSNYYRYCAGQIFPVVATGTRSGTLIGTNEYSYDSSVGKAAMHMGLVNEGETYKGYIKILEDTCPYFDATTRNGVTSDSSTYNSAYIFVTEDGTPIKPKGEITSDIVDENNITFSYDYTDCEDKGPVEYDGKTWYPYGTKVTITFSGEGTYSYTYLEHNYSTNTTTTLTKELSSGNTVTLSITYNNNIVAYIKDKTTNRVIHRKAEYIHIMLPQSEGWRAVGGTYLVGVDGNVKDSETIKGTNSYPVRLGIWDNHSRYDYSTLWNQSIRKAAVHIGLVNLGDNTKKYMYVNLHWVGGSNPVNYTASVRNGVSSLGGTITFNSSHVGSVLYLNFVDKYGINLPAFNKDNNDVTLSGYKVVPNTSGYPSFINDGTSIIPENEFNNNKGVTSSYVEIDLTNYEPSDTVKITLDVNLGFTPNNTTNYEHYGEIGIWRVNDSGGNTASYGYLIKTNGTVENGTKESDNIYSKLVEGGAKYRIYFYYKNNANAEGTMRINSLNVEKVEPNITVTPDPEVEPFTDTDGKVWYPYGTKFTINKNFDDKLYYTRSDKTPGYVSDNYNEIPLYDTTTFKFGYTNSYNDINEQKNAEITYNIMPLYKGKGSNNASGCLNSIGAIYPVEVTGTTSSGSVVGTAKYTYDSIISTAATHMGLVEVGETKTLHIKIIPSPEGGYIGTRQHNIVSSNYTTNNINGYVFVDEEGNEILEPIVTSNATLKGEFVGEEHTYPVYANNTYYFENDEKGSLVSNNKGQNGYYANSYIELDLSKYTINDIFRIRLNAETSCSNYGFAHITANKSLTYSGSTIATTGRIFYKSGITEAQDYGTIISGGHKYYLHLGYYRNGLSGEDVVKFHKLNIEKIEPTDTPTITIDSPTDPIEYEGELWYPYGTSIKIDYGIENYTNIANPYNTSLNNNYNYLKIKNEVTGVEERSYITVTSISGVGDKGTYITRKYVWNKDRGYYDVGNDGEWNVGELTHSRTYYAKYSQNSKETVQKINIMPVHYRSYLLHDGYSEQVGKIYPVEVIGKGTDRSIYGNNVYMMQSNISSSAVHMGLIDAEDTTPKLLYIKIVTKPAGGYPIVKKNNVTSAGGYQTSAANGFVFVKKDGTEILEPTVESATAVIGENNTIVANIDAVGQNGATIEKYYYSIDNGEFIETTSNTNTFTFAEEEASKKTHIIKMYVRDSNGAVSQTKEITTNVATSNVPPTFTLTDSDGNPIPEEKIVHTNDGRTWYPYGTNLTINYAGDMTNLIGYYNYIALDKNNATLSGSSTNSPSFTTTLTYSIKYTAFTRNTTTNKDTEKAEIDIYVMPSETLGLGNYYANEYLGNIYPVRVTGTDTEFAYGTDVYYRASSINNAATHMGLVNIDETKTVYIKIVKSPVGGYVRSNRNGVTTYDYADTYNGFVFVDEDGNEITRPKVDTLSVSSGDNEITVTANASSNNGNIIEYYYSIDNGEYVETTDNHYTFKNILKSGEHTIKVYVKDSNGDESAVKEIKGRKNIPTPIITFNKEPIIYNGEKWYPYDTQITIKYSDDDTMNYLKGYHRTINAHTKKMSSWGSTTYNTYSPNLTESMIYEAYAYETSVGEGEHIREKINIMVHPTSLQANYYNYRSENIYPVQVTGTTSGNIYGTDTYQYNSNISKAATHAGLVNVDETKILYIKIVTCPEGGYKGSTQNGITSSSSGNAYVGFTFVQ